MVTVTNKEVSQEEIAKYQEYYGKKHGVDPEDIEIVSLEFTDDGEVEVEYINHKETKFERIARITGYLSSTDRWNDSKKAELADRVKHVPKCHC